LNIGSSKETKEEREGSEGAEHDFGPFPFLFSSGPWSTFPSRHLPGMCSLILPPSGWFPRVGLVTSI